MDILWAIQLTNSDGTKFCTAENTSPAVRLRSSDSSGSDLGEYTGNSGSSGAFSQSGTATGIWAISIDNSDAQEWFLVQRYNGGWANVYGMAPVKADVSQNLKLSGGTMTGAIEMGDNKISGVDTISFNDTAGTIAGIKNSDLLDKSGAESVTGAWTMASVDATALKIGGTSLTVTAANINKAATEVENRSTEIEVNNTNYTVADEDIGVIKVTATTADVIITLPNLGSGNYGKIYTIILVNVSGGHTCEVKVDPGSSDYISFPHTGTSDTKKELTAQWQNIPILSLGYHFWLDLNI